MTKPNESYDPVTDIIPPIVALLGYGGLLPFVVLAAGAWFDVNHVSLWRDALIGYGAVILSFVGALHWGFAMSQGGMKLHKRTYSYIRSVVPALLAWVALSMMSKYAVMLLVVGFVVHFWQDKRLVHAVKEANAAGLPDWYLPLRLRLTIVACLALLSTYVS